MTIELDEWDLAWLARPHTDAEYRAEIKSALERCAMYSARIDRLEAELEQLRGQRAGCRYPACLDDGGRCQRMFAGECAGPKGVQPPRIEGYNTNRDQPTVTIKEVKP